MVNHIQIMLLKVRLFIQIGNGMYSQHKSWLLHNKTRSLWNDVLSRVHELQEDFVTFLKNQNENNIFEYLKLMYIFQSFVCDHSGAPYISEQIFVNL